MVRFTFVVPLFLGAGALLARGQPAGFTLVSPEEARAWNTPAPATPGAERERDLGAPGIPNCHAIPSGPAAPHNPQINIISPVLGKPIAAPLDIDLKFVAGAAAIRPDTFKVCYVGFVIMDLTKRVTDRVAVSAEGLKVTGADLPKGHHHLVMMIADQQGLVGSRDAIFDIN